MLNIIGFVLNLINEHVIWMYIGCLMIILFYVHAYRQARRDRDNTIFTIEKEIAAHKEGRAMSGIGFILGVAVVITAARFYLLPTLDLSAVTGPTATFTLSVPTMTRAILATATPTIRTPVATPTPRTTPILPLDSPTPQASLTVVRTAAPPAACPDPGVRITSPGMGATVSGSLVVQGTASHPRFQFYKVEYGLGETPSSWHVIHDIHRAPVTGGLLEELNTSTLPNGTCWIQLTVVDLSGNFPSPCRVRVTIRN